MIEGLKWWLLGVGIGGVMIGCILVIDQKLTAAQTVVEDTRAICSMVSEQCYPCGRACTPCEVTP